MNVYHGFVLTVEKPDVNHSFRALDFEKGFYVTSVQEQTERWAKRKAELFGYEKGIVSIYEMNEVTEGLYIKTFEPDLME